MDSLHLNDIAKFFDKDNFLSFFPISYMNTKEQLKAIVRLSIYFSIIMMLLSNDYRYMYIVVITLILTYAMYVVYLYDKKQKNAKLNQLGLINMNNSNQNCTIPSKDNPFMNFTLNEYTENPYKPAACDIQNDSVRISMKRNFNKGLNRNIDDIFGKNASDRQFYTTPNTQIINDQQGLADWLYKAGPTCKENTYNCTKNLYRHIQA